MSKIKIVMDSSLTIEPELIEKYDIIATLLLAMIDGVVYSDSDLREEGKLLNMIRNSKGSPKTDQPPIGVFAEVYESLMKNGAEYIVSTYITHILSEAVETTRQGANLVGADVTVIDSISTDQYQKFRVVQAAKLVQEGDSLEEVTAKAEEARRKSELCISVLTLESLTKSRRIERVIGLVSSFPNTKVVMKMVDCKLNPIIKGHGLKTLNKWLDNFIRYAKGKKVAEIGISYCDTADTADGPKEKLQVLGAPTAVPETGSIIQAHTSGNAFVVVVRCE